MTGPPVVYIATVNVTAQGISPLPRDGSKEQLQEAYEEVSMEAVKAAYETLDNMPAVRSLDLNDEKEKRVWKQMNNTHASNMKAAEISEDVPQEKAYFEDHFGD